jgi:LacI family transcriptional regulator
VAADEDAVDGGRRLAAGVAAGSEPGRLAAEGGLGGLAAEGGLGGVAAGGELGGLAADPELGGLTADRELGGLTADPTAPPTIYDVARAAGVSIASVSRVLNGQRNPRQETRERVLAAVAELGFVPDGAARALSARLKEVVGVIVRRPWPTTGTDEDLFADEAESLQYSDLINRGIETAAQRRGFDLLIRSVGVSEHDPGGRTLALARKSDGLILHDRVLEPDQMDRLSRQLPIVTLAGYATPTTANVHGDNESGMRALARHLLRDHGYPTLAYLCGYADSPDSIERQEVLSAETAVAGADLECGPEWQGFYFASGGAQVIDELLAAGRALPRAIVCANDQTAFGVMSALRKHGIGVPGQVAVTGFDDIPLARHLRTSLTTVRQPIRELGTTAFDVLYSMLNREHLPARDIVLPTELIRRESCGCPAPSDRADIGWYQEI